MWFGRLERKRQQQQQGQRQQTQQGGGRKKKQQAKGVRERTGEGRRGERGERTSSGAAAVSAAEGAAITAHDTGVCWGEVVLRSEKKIHGCVEE